MSLWIVHPQFAHVPECNGHIPLSMAFAQFVAVDCDVDPFDQQELRAELSEASAVQETSRWLLRLLQSGELRTASRALGGGAPAAIPLGHWQVDDVTERLLSSQYSRADPFNATAAPDSWIFVLEEDLLRLWEQRRIALGALGNVRRRADQAKVTATSSPSSVSESSSLLGLPQVEAMVGLKRSTIYKMVDEGSFPAQIRVGGRALWLRSDLETWLTTLTSAGKQDVANKHPN